MLKCVIFDLDGVLVSTDEYHYLAWKIIADKLDIPFNRDDNMHQRGVSRLESLEVVLRKGDRVFSDKEKVELAEEKNAEYVESLKGKLDKSCILEGVLALVKLLKAKNIKMIIGSSSKNANFILEKTELMAFMDGVVSGLDIENSKPHPEVFIKAQKMSGCEPCECLVVEDADTGVDAGLAAGMKVLAVGAAKDNKKATFALESLVDFDFDKISAYLEENAG